MDAKDIKSLIAAREFISVATCDLDGRPNAAPKLLPKVQEDYIYLVDYIIGRTFRNLSFNPRASLSFMDNNSLTGYQVNGKVTIVDSGEEYEDILKQLQQKKIDLSIKRVIEGVESGKGHKNFEVTIPEQFVILKLKIEELVEMSAQGTLCRERV